MGPTPEWGSRSSKKASRTFFGFRRGHPPPDDIEKNVLLGRRQDLFHPKEMGDDPLLGLLLKTIDGGDDFVQRFPGRLRLPQFGDQGVLEMSLFSGEVFELSMVEIPEIPQTAGLIGDEGEFLDQFLESAARFLGAAVDRRRSSATGKKNPDRRQEGDGREQKDDSPSFFEHRYSLSASLAGRSRRFQTFSSVKTWNRSSPNSRAMIRRLSAWAA